MHAVSTVKLCNVSIPCREKKIEIFDVEKNIKNRNKFIVL